MWSADHSVRTVALKHMTFPLSCSRKKLKKNCQEFNTEKNELKIRIGNNFQKLKQMKRTTTVRADVAVRCTHADVLPGKVQVE